MEMSSLDGVGLAIDTEVVAATEREDEVDISTHPFSVEFTMKPELHANLVDEQVAAGGQGKHALLDSTFL